MIIENHYKFGDFRGFNPSTLEIAPLRTTDTQKKKNVTTEGFFAVLAGTAFVLFRDETLRLAIDKKCFVFEELRIFTKCVRRDQSPQDLIKQERHLVIEQDSICVFHSDYTEIMKSFENDPTSFIEDEDFDFGLFLENLSKNPERQDRLFCR